MLDMDSLFYKERPTLTEWRATQYIQPLVHLFAVALI